MKLRIIFPSVVLAFLIIIIILSLGYSYEAKLFPLLICVPVAVLLVGQILREVRAKVKEEAVPGEKKIATKGALAKALAPPAWIAGLLLSLYLLGYLVGTPLFTLLYLKLHGEKWLLTVIVVLAIIAVVYGGFTLGLKIPLYKGLLFS